MSAAHADPDPYAALESRVQKLEEAVHQQLPGKVDSVGWAVGILHHDLRALREETAARFDKADERFTGIDQRLDRHGELLGQHTGMLRDLGAKMDELLRRLPE